MSPEHQIIKVGLIGCGEVAQTIHIPTLNNFVDSFKITYLCDVSEQALLHCQRRVAGSPVTITKNAEELCKSPGVDLVFVLSSTEYHAEHVVLALDSGKAVFVEKPMAMNERDLWSIWDALRRTSGKLMVGYMRRYATAFIDAVEEIGGLERISYARVRDIIGQNAFFVNQSGTFPERFDDYSIADRQEKSERLAAMLEEGLHKDLNVPVTPESAEMWQLLGGLGSHDLSVMREALGMPVSVLGCSLNSRDKFWNVLFQFPGFACSYESGIDSIPRFDAHLEVYSKTRLVTVQYDTPYIKGLPVTMTVRENVDGAYHERIIRKTYEDPYTLEMKELHALVTEGKPAKTTAEDAGKDLETFQMIMQAGKSQFE